MPDITATVQLGNFPVGYCWTDPQTFADDLVDLLQITVPSSAAVFVGANAPNDTSNIWVRTVGGYLEGIYVYLGGWYRPHPVPPSSSERRIWVGPEDGTASGIWSYDGGDGDDPAGTPPTLVSGAMWEVDHQFDFAFPLGCGTGPISGTVVGAEDPGGEEEHVLTTAELAEHTHVLANNIEMDNGSLVAAGEYISAHGWDKTTPHAVESRYALVASSGGAEPNIGKVLEAGEDESHNNMPPYVGVYFIRRTARQFISAT